MKTIEDSLNIPTENENSEMQLGMIAHTYNPSAWEFETIISSYTQGISKEKKKKGGGSTMLQNYTITVRLCI